MPRLLIRKGEGQGKDHALSGTCIVGRHTSANFVLGDQLASRNHFRIVSEGGAWFVEDLGSTNGTIVNGRRQQRAQLTDGDVIVAGTTELQFVQKDLLGGAPVRPALPAVPAAVAPAPAVPAVPPPAAVAVPPAVPAVPAARAVLPAVPAIPRPAVPAVPAKPSVPSPAKPAAPVPSSAKPAAPAAPAKPPIQAPIPTKKRR